MKNSYINRLHFISTLPDDFSINFISFGPQRPISFQLFIPVHSECELSRGIVGLLFANSTVLAAIDPTSQQRNRVINASRMEV